MYNFLHALLGALFRFFCHWQIKGVENIPLQGGVIVAANHISNLDPPLLGCSIPVHRQIHFMAKEELFAIPVFSPIIRKLNAFPVRRGTADRMAIRQAISLLEGGALLGLFPEGTRSVTGELGAPEPGVAMIALKTGAVIVPAAVKGTNTAFDQGLRRPRLSVTFGPPIYVEKGRPDKEALEELSGRVMAAIKELL